MDDRAREGAPTGPHMSLLLFNFRLQLQVHVCQVHVLVYQVHAKYIHLYPCSCMYDGVINHLNYVIKVLLQCKPSYSSRTINRMHT